MVEDDEEVSRYVKFRQIDISLKVVARVFRIQRERKFSNNSLDIE